ncbi:hypothetical protein Zmor_020566 [Zophobas morio]|uniref:Uncharacterized protein n=1 Tax=Zophobas morio TaxID=2755281 RepID=A0AA38I3R3_9CUCU|nr:hypothetical protein Zmor_020566 [Zophobas morio]
MNTGFEEFLQTLQIVQIFTMFASGFFENLKILRTVRDHINNRIIYKDAVLDNNDRKSYGLLLGRIRQLGATEGDESETSDVQRGAGERSDTVNGDHKYFNEKGECEAFIRKFGLTARRMEFSFKDVNDDEIPQNWLKNAFQELLDYITRGFQPTSMIGVVIENEEFPDKPAGISFRRLAAERRRSDGHY